MERLVGDDSDHAAVLAASVLAERLRHAIAERGRASIAVSGGSTPAVALRLLGRVDLPWGGVHVFQVDERIVPDGDPDRNLAVLAEALPDATIHAMPVATRNTAAYHAALTRIAGDPPRLDVVQLGLGDDGHTASWPPGVTVDDTGVALVTGFRGHDRMTLTPSVVNAAGMILWLVTGVSKQGVVAQLIAGDPTIPAALVRTSPDVMLVTDTAATPS